MFKHQYNHHDFNLERSERTDDMAASIWPLLIVKTIVSCVLLPDLRSSKDSNQPGALPIDVHSRSIKSISHILTCICHLLEECKARRAHRRHGCAHETHCSRTAEMFGWSPVINTFQTVQVFVCEVNAVIVNANMVYGASKVGKKCQHVHACNKFMSLVCSTVTR